MAKQSINSPCPCGSGKKYKKCCMVFHKGANPKDPLTLMKSRYSAFAMQKIDYIIKTSTFQKDYDDLLSFSKGCDFLALEIVSFENGKEEAFVTFFAKIECNGVDSSFREKSRFVMQDGIWLYESGEVF
jgi:SEC-C motif-containing protein